MYCKQTDNSLYGPYIYINQSKLKDSDRSLPSADSKSGNRALIEIN